MFHFPGCRLPNLCIRFGISAEADGLPHSEISGSTPACGSPKLIAAYHVLRRLSVPRHPPCALRNLTTKTLRRRSDKSPVYGARPPAVAGGLSTFLPVKLSKIVRPEGRSPKPGTRRSRSSPRAPRRPEMVGVPGLEPGASSLSGTRSNQLSYTPDSGGAEGIRTPDILLAKQALWPAELRPPKRGRPPKTGQCDAGPRRLLGLALDPRQAERAAP